MEPLSLQKKTPLSYQRSLSKKRKRTIQSWKLSGNDNKSCMARDCLKSTSSSPWNSSASGSEWMFLTSFRLWRCALVAFWSLVRIKTMIQLIWSPLRSANPWKLFAGPYLHFTSATSCSAPWPFVDSRSAFATTTCSLHWWSSTPSSWSGPRRPTSRVRAITVT